jgi:hypothetical protein
MTSSDEVDEMFSRRSETSLRNDDVMDDGGR